jgi:hypothetical protein
MVRVRLSRALDAAGYTPVTQAAHTPAQRLPFEMNFQVRTQI